MYLYGLLVQDSGRSEPGGGLDLQSAKNVVSFA